MNALRYPSLFLAAACVAFASFSPPAAAQTSPDRIVRVRLGNGTMFYVPENMLAAEYRLEPPYDPRLPVDTVFQATPQIYIWTEQAARRRPIVEWSEAIQKPALWRDFFPYIEIDPLNTADGSYKYAFPAGEWPIRTDDYTFECSIEDYHVVAPPQNGRPCVVSREAGARLGIRYSWDGRDLDPKDWEKQDMRVQNLIEWLQQKPDQRPPKVPDWQPKQ